MKLRPYLQQYKNSIVKTLLGFYFLSGCFLPSLAAKNLDALSQIPLVSLSEFQWLSRDQKILYIQNLEKVQLAFEVRTNGAELVQSRKFSFWWLVVEAREGESACWVGGRRSQRLGGKCSTQELNCSPGKPNSFLCGSLYGDVCLETKFPLSDISRRCKDSANLEKAADNYALIQKQIRQQYEEMGCTRPESYENQRGVCSQLSDQMGRVTEAVRAKIGNWNRKEASESEAKKYQTIKEGMLLIKRIQEHCSKNEFTRLDLKSKVAAMPGNYVQFFHGDRSLEVRSSDAQIQIRVQRTTRGLEFSWRKGAILSSEVFQGEQIIALLKSQGQLIKSKEGNFVVIDLSKLANKSLGEAAIAIPIYPGEKRWDDTREIKYIHNWQGSIPKTYVIGLEPFQKAVGIDAANAYEVDGQCAYVRSQNPTSNSIWPANTQESTAR